MAATVVITLFYVLPVLLCVLMPVIVVYWRTLRFYVKYFLYNSCYMVIGCLSIPFCLLKPGDVDNGRWAALFTRESVKHLFGIKIHVRHIERLQSETPYIIICNHQSNMDNMAMMEILPPRCTAIMKKSTKFAGTVGLLCILCGVIFVDRSNRSQAKQALEQTMKIIKKKNAKVWIFPEGTRKDNTECSDPMLPFKKGAFNLAVHAQVPIVPVVCSSQSKFFSYKEKKFTQGKFTVTVMPHVDTFGLTLEDVPTLAEKTRQSMIDVYKTHPEIRTLLIEMITGHNNNVAW
ncbi:1-acyl-sn-glycerol-3-phosphate acyltransferase alpha-like [Saccoglossus kowalevskii]|uniref:1-acyl-sn-glycerol-3-phosphate acyltransferase n=1 Tax=Saccoglossus kowalevskii TaxID=10224 RepID=A0ABM0GTC1_SACKO|nr:PREDICTED: 1-acyl-sn-glycerol-3-phosphate acyltransferase alpha-like [Saccoglossus kowalevskii]